MIPGLVIDSFAGGGGASLGISRALGRDVDVAINHDPEAVAMHAANHPGTHHYCSNVWQADPAEVVRAAGGGPVALAWFSPDCKHFSKAKGGRPVKRNIRDLAWIVVLWARRVRPRVIMLENVEEFRTWGPVDIEGRPCPERKGATFERWAGDLKRLGYRMEYRELRACDYGAPTVRKRLFVIARCDGLPIVWPEPTHGAPGNDKGLPPYRTAAECIDWSLPCPSIFLTPEEARKIGVRRPLAEATLRRIARGVKRYVLDHPDPFVIPIDHGSTTTSGRSVHEPLTTITAENRHALVAPHVTKFRGGATGHDCRAPLHTVTANSAPGGHMGGATPLGLVAPTLVQMGYGEREGQAPRVPGLDKPLGTVVAGGCKHALVAAFMAQHNTGVTGHDAREPVSTIVQKGCTQGLVTAHLSHAYTSNTAGGQGDPRRPAKTVLTGGHHALVYSFLTKYYGTDQDPRLEEPLHTVTTKDRFGLVTVEVGGVPYVVADIGMRMLAPRELFRAQGFGDDYVIDPVVDGKPLTKTAQIRMCGNSVCPPLAEALVRENLSAERRAEVAA